MNNAFVINLHSRSEQFEEVRRSFEPYGISCKRFSAIKHSEGFVGCALSHLEIVAQAKKNDWPWVMVFEDDCMARDAMKDWPVISRFLAQESDRWDLFLGGCTYVSPVKTERVSATMVDLVECVHAVATHFIIYNKSSYDQILSWNDLSQPLEKRPAIDIFMHQCALKKWVPVYFVAWQKAHYSAIEKKLIDYRLMFEFAEQTLNTFKLFEALYSTQRGVRK